MKAPDPHHLSPEVTLISHISLAERGLSCGMRNLSSVMRDLFLVAQRLSSPGSWAQRFQWSDLVAPLHVGS